MTETLKLLKHFAATCLILLCLTAALGAATVVRNNSRLLTFGQAGQQVAFSMDTQVMTFQTGEVLHVLPRISPWLRLARHAPAPLGAWLLMAYAAQSSG
ncbi:MAG: hypothetical protein FWE40_06020 [Oscillospiraceae bacterium]|jgi:hypothetical protein|nr:hypothetical protein [Oscillospiraceae bacterium]